MFRSELVLVSVVHRSVREFVLEPALCADTEFRTRQSAMQPEGAADEIRVVMRLENVRDRARPPFE